MRVVHISASDQQGGASRAAWRVHRALLERGLGSQLLVVDKSSDDDSVEAIVPTNQLDPVQAQANAVVRHVYRDTNRTDLSNTHFSLPLDGLDLREHPLVRAADLIHLHWVSSMLSPRSIDQLRQLGKPVVWTLHDMEPFTGGCHFSAGCAGYVTSCSCCPQLRRDPFSVPSVVLRDKIELLSDERTTLIAPSCWMAMRARESRLFRRAADLIVVPNCVDTRVFGRHSAAEARQALGLSNDATYVLCVVDQGLQTRKGIHLLGQIMQACGQDPRFQAARGRLLWVGPECPYRDHHSVPFDDLGHLASEQQMALAYAAADVVLLPSLEDNLPNVMLEALGSGTPVVAFGVGGIPEVLQDSAYGRIASPSDVAGLAASLVALLADSDALEAMRPRCRSLVEEHYSYAVIADRHAQVYEAALAQHSAGKADIPGEVCTSTDPGPAMTALLPELRLHCLVEQVASLDARLVRSEQDRRAQGDVIGGLTADLSERLSLIQRLDSELAKRTTLNERLRSELAERLTLIERLHSESAARLTLIERRHSELAERSNLIHRLQAELARRLELIHFQDRELAARLSLVEELDTYRQHHLLDDAAARRRQPAEASDASGWYARIIGLRQRGTEVLNHFMP